MDFNQKSLLKNKIDIKALNIANTEASNRANVTKKPNLRDKIIAKALDEIHTKASDSTYTEIGNKVDL